MSTSQNPNRVGHTKTPDGRLVHPLCDLICAWANGFQVQFRYRHHDPANPDKIYMWDEDWYTCGPHYAAFNGINEHRIHPDAIDAWEQFKRKPLEDAARDEQARVVGYIQELAHKIPANRMAYLSLVGRIGDSLRFTKEQQ